jgi:2-oxoglutarate dehydrogenase complex dehydrogenase (E1) component-like enzyme
MPIKYEGRKSSGTTAEGSVKAHQKEQQRIIMDVLGLASPAAAVTVNAAAK